MGEARMTELNEIKRRQAEVINRVLQKRGGNSLKTIAAGIIQFLESYGWKVR